MSYHVEDCNCSDCETYEALDISKYESLIDKIAKALHEGSMKPEELSQEIITQTYNDLAEAASNGYGSKFNTFPKQGKNTTAIELKKNLYAFSGAKTYAELEELNKLLVDGDGKIRPFNEFLVLAKQINRQYNLNYLQAEYQTARTGAQMAEKWERLQETKDLFPNLKYRTVGDSRVRRDHERLDGVIKPIDDAFWSRYYPPLDWRCRCDVVATAEDSTEIDESELPKVKFKGNVGKDKEIFTKNGSFFKLLNTNENAIKNAEISKLNSPTQIAHATKSGKKVQVSIYADSKDLTENIRIATIVVNELKANVLIRPHLDGRILEGKKNPEYLINNKLAERKTPESTNYKKSLAKANSQECEIVVIDLAKNGDTVENAYYKITNILSNNIHPFIQEVYIVSKNGKEVKVYKRKKQPKK